VGSRNSDELLVSHLLFAGDTLMFCEANSYHLHHMRCLFLCFDAILGLKTKLSKLELVPTGAVEDVGGLACILGCRVSSLTMKYFGLPLGDSDKTKLVRGGIIEKMERCLVG